MKHSINKIVALSLFSSFTLNAYTSDESKKMNIVLIMADDFGYECVSANGGESYQTPNIDRLAERGMKFNHCYANPLSTPTRVQLMTGKYNVRNYTAFAKLEREEVTFGNILKNAGYATCIAGKWQLGKEFDSPQHFGFEQSCLWQQAQGAYDENRNDSRYANPIMEYNGDRKEYTTGEFGPDIACNFLLEFIRENKERPFLAYYPMILTHCPFVATPDSQGWKAERSETYKGDARYFSDMVEYMDKLVGKIIDELDVLGLTDKTLIIFTGDNGTDQPVVSFLNGKSYPGGKGKTIDSGIHVPLIVSHPNIKKGSVNNNLIDFTDFLPTLCDAIGIAAPANEDIDGISFYPQLKGDNRNIRKWTYCWFAPRDVDNKKAKVFAREYRYKLYRSGEFYDIETDFEEKNPIQFSSLTEEQKHIYILLQEAINKYEDVR